MANMCLNSLFQAQHENTAKRNKGERGLVRGANAFMHRTSALFLRAAPERTERLEEAIICHDGYANENS